MTAKVSYVGFNVQILGLSKFNLEKYNFRFYFSALNQLDNVEIKKAKKGNEKRLKIDVITNLQCQQKHTRCH
jgi:hypothetical protein